MANERLQRISQAFHTPDVDRGVLGDFVVPRYILLATATTAIHAANESHRFTGGIKLDEDLPKDEKNLRTKIIDTGGALNFGRVLDSQDQILFVGIDAEGAKEAAADKLGEEMPLTIGNFGSGAERYVFVVDVIENTKAVAHGRPNAISVASFSDDLGIKPIDIDPETGKKYNYYRKFFAPAVFENSVSLSQEPVYNLRAISSDANINPSDITVAIMDRACNASMIQQAKDFHANVKVISEGDFEWCIQAIQSLPKKPTVMMGRGGAEEGAIAAVAASVSRATCQMREIHESDKERDMPVSEETTKVWTARDYVTGKPSKSGVIFTAITENTTFGLRQVRRSGNNPNRYFVDSMLISARDGFRKIRNSMIELAP